MHQAFRILPLAVAMSLLPGCDKTADKTAEHETAAVTQPATAAQPFRRSGELLSVHVDNMPRAAILAKLGELTGAKITAEGDNNLALAVHADDASLRQVLSQVLADAPYTATMQYANLQDSFPVSVSVTRYQNGAQGKAAPAEMPLADPAAMLERARAQQPAVAEVAPEPAEPDFSAMPSEERMTYFLAQTEDDQVSLIFDMEPTPEDAKLMAELMQKDEITSDVKVEMLDSLSNGEYEDSLPALQVALQSDNPEVTTRAVEVLAELGSEKDIPTLQKLAEDSADEAVKQAAQDGIDSLR